MINEWQIKKHICEIGRRLYDAGFVAANDGNISYRLGNGQFIFTPTGVSKGFLQPSDIVVVDSGGNLVGGGQPATSEVPLHLEIYRELPHVNAVVHAHPPHATAFAVSHVDLPTCILPEVEIALGRVPIAGYDTPGTKALADTILSHLRNKANTVLLANHGAVACDTDLDKAYFHLETLDMYCKILLLSKQIGKIEHLPAGKVDELMQIKQRMGIADPRVDGEVELCTLAGSDDFLRGFSTRPIPQHTPSPDGHGRGTGIAGAESQSNEPQPMPQTYRTGPAMVAGRELPAAPLGGSSDTARERAAKDEMERLVQFITDKIVEMSSRAG